MVDLRITTPEGRLVQGDCFDLQEKDADGNPRVVKSGPNAGQPSPQVFVALAIPKTSPEWPAFVAQILQQAAAEWPHLFPATVPAAPKFGVMATPCVDAGFAFKVRDGDGVDKKGNSLATKEGFAGHWIVSASQGYQPKVVVPGGNGTWETVTYDKATGRPKPIVRGDYVRIALKVVGNKSSQTPGLFVNPEMIALSRKGVEIVSGPDANEAFGAAPAGVLLPPPATGALPLPPGVTAAAPPPPAVTGPVMLPAANGATYEQMIAAGWTDAAMIAGGMMQAPVVAAAAPPPPAVAAAAPPPPAVTGPVMLPAADGATYEQMIAAGWTDAAMIAGGMMQAPVEPYSGFRNPDASASAAPPPPGAVPSATGAGASGTKSPSRVMTAAAGGATYETFIASGWTDEQLIAQGYMTAA